MMKPFISSPLAARHATAVRWLLALLAVLGIVRLLPKPVTQSIDT